MTLTKHVNQDGYEWRILRIDYQPSKPRYGQPYVLGTVIDFDEDTVRVALFNNSES